MRVCTRALSCVQDDARACWRGPKQGGHQRRRLVGPCACVVCVCACRASSRGAARSRSEEGEGAGESERSGLPAEMPPTQKGASAERAVPAPATTPQKHARDGLRCCLRPSLLLTWLSTPVTRRSSVAMPRLPPRLPPRLLLRPVASSPSRSPSPFSSPPPLDSARRPPTGDALAAPPIPVAPATFIKTISSPAPPSFSSPPPS